MKKGAVLLLFLLLIIFVACGGAAAPTSTPKPTAAAPVVVPTATPTPTSIPTPQLDLAAILRQHYEAVNKGDAPVAVGFFTDDAEMVRGACSSLLPCKGKTEILRQMTN